MSKWVCRWCIMETGIRGSDLDDWPDIDDKEARARHVESEHHIPVQREGETGQETYERFKREQPEAGGPNCKCPKCKHERTMLGESDE